jgi:hypothetical protein
MSGYSCNMDTATFAPTVTSPVRTEPPAVIDFDTRMSLVGIAMDVLLEVPEGTQAALSAALKEADGLAVAGALAERQRAAQQRPELFQSQPILKAAGDLIRARGWTKGAYDDARGRLCAIGAIRVATRGEAWEYHPEPAGERDAINVLLERIADAFGPGLSVPGWNDRQTSAEDVLKLLF